MCSLVLQDKPPLSPFHIPFRHLSGALRRSLILGAWFDNRPYLATPTKLFQYSNQVKSCGPKNLNDGQVIRGVQVENPLRKRRKRGGSL